MNSRKTVTLMPRLALALAGIVTLGGAVGIGHAQSQIAAQSSAAVTAQAADAPRFVPSDAPFDEAFAELQGAAALPALPDHAVDLSTIEPPLEPAARSLGSGVASYYGRAFAGRPTANGESFDPQELTAAHRSLPFGSRVRVTNPRNGQSVIVRINDRGPFVAGRMIDVSRSAAEQLGMIQAGHATVELELLTS